MKLCFHAAEESDIPVLYALNRELIERYEDPKAIDTEEVLAWVRRKLEKRIRDYVCVTADGEKAAYYSFLPAGDEMELDDLYVLPPYRNRGIGTAVLQKCLAESEKPIFFYVFNRNTRAVALYERLGFRVAETVSATRSIMRGPR